MRRLRSLGLVAKGQKVNLKKLSELYGIDGCNIEGNTIAQRYLDQNIKLLWVNLCTFLDFPLAEKKAKLHSAVDITKELRTISDVTTEWINHGDSYVLKEHIIHEFHYKRNDYTILMILTWYIDHASELTGKEHPIIVVHTHRGGSGVIQNGLLEEFLFEYYNDNVPVKIVFRVGYIKDTLIPIENVDIHISLSLIMGLNELYESGDILVPTRWTVLDTEAGEWSSESIGPNVENHFTEELSRNLFEDQERVERCSNITGYQSHDGLRLSFGGHIAQIDKIYEPTMQELFRVVK